MRTGIAITGLMVGGLAAMLSSCGGGEKASADSSAPAEAVSVGVSKVGRKPLNRTLTVSSELVPYQEIDVYAKEAGYVKKLYVDYGTRVKEGQVMAILEIPELQLQVAQDDAMIKNAQDQIARAQREVDRWQATVKPLHSQYDRLNGVAQSKKGMVAQQEVDDAEGKYQAAEAQVEAAKANLQAANSELLEAQAKRERDQVLSDYSKIAAPFTGVVTQRYANQGTLMQAGTNSSTQALPLVKLSQDDRFRLVIPVPESYVRYIHVDDQVGVNVPSLNRNLPGKVARFSTDVREDTRTMHTEVDILNPNHALVPGMYAEATIVLEHKPDALTVPLQAVIHNGDQISVLLVDANNKLQSRSVTLGIQTATDGEVTSGLEEGDTVVVSDRSGLKAGQEVRPKVIEVTDFPGQEEKK